MGLKIQGDYNIMFKILLLISSFLFAESISVNIPCEELREYSTACQTSTTTPSADEANSTKREYKGTIHLADEFGKDSGRPFVGKVKISYLDDNLDDVFGSTNNTGDLSLKVLKDKAFMLSAYDGEDWLLYKTKFILKITSTGKSSWREFNEDTRRWKTHELRILIKGRENTTVSGNLIELSTFHADKYALNFKNINSTSFSLTPTDNTKSNQGAYILAPTEAGATYEITINTNKRVNVYFSNFVDGKYEASLRSKARVKGVNKDLTLNSFKAVGSISYFYFAPQEEGEITVKNITIKKVKTYPQITHGEKQYLPYTLTSRIIWGQDGASYKKGDPFVGKTRIKGTGWEYVVMTNDNGVFTFNVTDRHEFILSAWDGSKWVSYPNTFSINIYDNLFEKRVDKWVTIGSLKEIKLK